MRTAARLLLQLPAMALALAMLPSAYPQNWPTKPVRLVASFPPGTPGDVIARLIQPALQAAWNQTVVVENKPGRDVRAALTAPATKARLAAMDLRVQASTPQEAERRSHEDFVKWGAVARQARLQLD